MLQSPPAQDKRHIKSPQKPAQRREALRSSPPAQAKANIKIPEKPAKRRSAKSSRGSEDAGQWRLKELTQEIAKFAARRQLAKARGAFDQMRSEGLPIGVHAYASLINAHVNSGSVAGAVRIFEEMRDHGLHPNVIVYTALLKGHCRVGDITEAARLLEGMVLENPPVTPDSRTVNTFLRGCGRAGDVDAAVSLLTKASEWGVPLDAVSYGFVVRLTAQDLRLDSARQVTEQLATARQLRAKRTSNADASEPGRPPCLFWAAGKCKRGSSCKFLHDTGIVQYKGRREEREHLETAALIHLNLARAAALLGRWAECRSDLDRSDEASRALRVFDDNAGTSAGTSEDASASAQLMDETERIRRFALAETAPQLRSYFGMTFLFAPCGQGTPEHSQHRSFAEAVSRTMGARGFQKQLTRRYKRCVSVSGRLRWQRIFRSRAPVNLEICSGSGEWIVAQAQAHADNWAAVEIMHDRVYDIFSRMVLEGVRNLCVLRGDASHILPCLLTGSVAHVFINFPEPPHVSGDEDAESSLHLLTKEFFQSVRDVLMPGGKLTILSDNGRYCQQLAGTVASIRQSGAPAFGQMDVQGDFEDIDGVRLHRGLPGKDAGHVADVRSRFDQRWAQEHRTDRFFMALVKL